MMSLGGPVTTSESEILAFQKITVPLPLNKYFSNFKVMGPPPPPPTNPLKTTHWACQNIQYNIQRFMLIRLSWAAWRQPGLWFMVQQCFPHRTVYRHKDAASGGIRPECSRVAVFLRCISWVRGSKLVVKSVGFSFSMSVDNNLPTAWCFFRYSKPESCGLTCSLYDK